jgi:Ca-activated chloride channel homolog
VVKNNDFSRSNPSTATGLLTILAFLLSTAPPLQAQSVHKSLQKGEQFYRKQEYKQAEEAYRAAENDHPRSPGIAYNLGNTFYRQGRYVDAEQQFQKAAAGSTSAAGKADALHNLGNSALKQEKYGEAAAAYENSLRFRPGDPQTKINLQYAKKKKKEQEEQQKKQQQQNEEQQNRQDQQKEQQKPSDGQPQNQQQPQQQQQPQEQPAQSGKMSREEAKRILETAVGPEDQRTAKKYREKTQKKAPQAGQKDW